MKKISMEKAREYLEKSLSSEEAVAVSRLTFPPHQPHTESSFYEYLVLRGVRVDRVQPGYIYCSFTVPHRLTDENGNLSNGVIASLVDEIGAAAIREDGRAMDVSVDMSISYISAAKMNRKDVNESLGKPVDVTNRKIGRNLFTAVLAMGMDELEIISRCLGKLGRYAGTSVLIRNKATGEVVAEGRHSLFSKPASKM